MSVKLSLDNDFEKLKNSGENLHKWPDALKDVARRQGMADAVNVMEGCGSVYSCHHPAGIYNALDDGQGFVMHNHWPKMKNGDVVPQQYEGDFFSNDRGLVDNSFYKDANLAEALLVSQSSAICSLIHSALEPDLQCRMDKIEDYANAKNWNRSDCMMRIILRALATNSDMNGAPKACTIGIHADFLTLMMLKANKGETVEDFLLRFHVLKAKLHQQGWYNNHPAEDTEDYLDFLLGQSVVKGITGIPGMSELVKVAAQNCELESPTCTYAWAVGKAKEWSDTVRNMNIATGGSSGGVSDSVKIAELEAKIVKMVHDHGEIATDNNNKKRKAKGEAGGSNDNSFKKNIKSRKNRYCIHCKQHGHYASFCKDATLDERKNYFSDWSEQSK